MPPIGALFSPSAKPSAKPTAMPLVQPLVAIAVYVVSVAMASPLVATWLCAMAAFVLAYALGADTASIVQTTAAITETAETAKIHSTPPKPPPLPWPPDPGSMGSCEPGPRMLGMGGAAMVTIAAM